MTLLQLFINVEPVVVRSGCTVAAALRVAGDGTARMSISGQSRAPFCGMGVCQECRVTIDGQQRLACQTLCQDGMQVRLAP